MELSFCIYATGTCQRLDVFLVLLLGESRSTVKKWFQEELISPRFKPSEMPRIKTEISIQSFLFPHHRKLSPNPSLQFPILYEDDALLVINKTRGFCVNAVRYTETQTIANFFLAHTPSLLTWEHSPLDSGVVHRLDQWTSGCLVGAKTPQALHGLQAQFKNRRVQKTYIAIVEGTPTRGEHWEDLLIHHPKNPRKMQVVTPKTPQTLIEKARQAILAFEPLETLKGPFTKVRIHLKTGRMHQIRVQFSSRGFPVYGDTLYGAQQKTSFEGYWLHAYQINFSHPITQTQISCTAEIPKELPYSENSKILS